MIELQASDKSLFYDNSILSTNLSEISKHYLKRKGKGSRIQFELEEELAKVKADLTTSLERNSELERKLVRDKVDLEKALK